MSVRKITYRDKEIIVIDYSGQKEDEMIQTLSEAIKLIHTLEKPALLLSIFNKKNYATPKFLRYLETEIKATEEIILKSAVIGLNEVKVWILKGINLWLKKKIISFETYEEALNALTE